ncbi:MULTISPECIES: GNAT family N-acetyltransferase [Halobacterium]|uniref:GNAT family N-acetyltransferase n=1 Tax=Halobacterium TaxID=2239 RepID=UPI00073F3729|nr:MULTISPECIES: GNAT family protein [Halobacterium]MCG1004334.1 GNAT family N-acetyltransferase [Halobacterium noricense]
MPGPAFARGETVSLHPIEEEDHEFIQYGRNHPDVRVPLTDTTIKTVEDVAEMLEDEDYHFLICVDEQSESTDGASSEGRSPSDRSSGRSPREDGETASTEGEDGDPEPVGVVAFGWVSSPGERGNLMYWVAPECQGNGYVSEGTELFLDYAFGECGFHKVDARVLVPNEPSWKALEKLGFEREGRRRDDAIVEGEYVDAYSYGLLADEWLDN